MSSPTERRKRLRQFCKDAGLPRDAVEAFVARHSCLVAEMRRGGHVTCDLALNEVDGIIMAECDFHPSNGGATHSVRFAASGSSALGSAITEMQTPVLAMRLVGLLLAELDMQARVQSPPGAITTVCNRDAKRVQPFANLAPDRVTRPEVFSWIERQAAFVRTKMARTEVACHLTVCDGWDSPRVEAWFECDDGDVGIVSLHCSGVTYLGSDGGDFASLPIAMAVAGQLLVELGMCAYINA